MVCVLCVCVRALFVSSCVMLYGLLLLFGCRFVFVRMFVYECFVCGCLCDVVCFVFVFVCVLVSACLNVFVCFVRDSMCGRVCDCVLFVCVFCTVQTCLCRVFESCCVILCSPFFLGDVCVWFVY